MVNVFYTGVFRIRVRLKVSNHGRLRYSKRHMSSSLFRTGVVTQSQKLTIESSLSKCIYSFNRPYIKKNKQISRVVAEILFLLFPEDVQYKNQLTVEYFSSE